MKTPIQSLQTFCVYMSPFLSLNVSVMALKLLFFQNILSEASSRQVKLCSGHHLPPQNGQFCFLGFLLFQLVVVPDNKRLVDEELFPRKALFVLSMLK